VVGRKLTTSKGQFSIDVGPVATRAGVFISGRRLRARTPARSAQPIVSMTEYAHQGAGPFPYGIALL
jgi:hypothetical protein